ncbi:MAG: hypothetical protein KA144_14880 [Xanthomonadaceae bacterium]|nr:hypothetical protein [Xanthomonadaceae bacterium]
MKQGIIKGVAIAAFAVAMSISGSASAAGPNIVCSTSLAGKTVHIVSGNYRYYYICRPPTWIFVKACPINGGPCFF